MQRRPTPQGEPDFSGARYCRHYALSQRTALEDTCPPLGLMEVIRRTLREMVAYLVKRRPTPQGEPDFPGARYCRHYALSQRTALEDTCPPLGDIRWEMVPCLVEWRSKLLREPVFCQGNIFSSAPEDSFGGHMSSSRTLMDKRVYVAEKGGLTCRTSSRAPPRESVFS